MPEFNILHLDYETRSRVDLFDQGAYVYCSSTTTDIICLGWAFNADEPEIWIPGEPFPKGVLEHLNAGLPRSLYAHNAQFERLITKHVLPKYIEFTQPPIEAWYCTAAQARARALPGSLGDLGACLVSIADKSPSAAQQFQKDKRGKELIKLLCIPNHEGDFCDDPEPLDEMYVYCKQDIIAERVAAMATPPLTDEEHLDWVLVEKKNDRGLRIDIELAKAATIYADAEVEEISKKLTRVTDGEITRPQQFKRIKDYLEPYMAVDDGIRKAMTRIETDRRSGEEKRRIACDRDARTKLMSLEKEQPGRLPANVKDLVELIDEAGRSSVHKYRNMVQRAGDDDRVKGCYIPGGAVQTGRHSSVGIQVHNLPRRTMPNPDITRQIILQGYPLVDGVMDTLSGMLRHTIMAADGHSFVCGDWSSIEARLLPYLACDDEADRVLDIFRQQDADPEAPDIYKVAASAIFHIPPTKIDKAQRQIGKVCTLALGYGGGIRAFQSMARAYSIHIPDDEAQNIVKTWRHANRWTPNFWTALDSAARSAVKYPSEMYQVGLVKYCCPDPGAPLYCELPSGRILSYPDPKLEAFEGLYGTELRFSSIKAQWKPKRGEKEWGRVNLYGGLLAENITQAAAADILRHAMRLCDEDRWPLTGTTHDELMLEVREDEVSDATDALEAIMLDKPSWAKGLPLSCEIWAGDRYQK